MKNKNKKTFNSNTYWFNSLNSGGWCRGGWGGGWWAMYKTLLLTTGVPGLFN